MASGDIRRLIDMIKDQDGEGSGLDADLVKGLDLKRVLCVFPQWFGAIGDKVSDDTSAIQSAINYASSISEKNKYVIVLIPYGDYKITSQIIVKRGVCLHCNGIIHNYLEDKFTPAVIFEPHSATTQLRLFGNLGSGVVFGEENQYCDILIGNVRLWNIGEEYDSEKGSKIGVKFTGYNFKFNSLDIDGGNIGVDINLASDIRGDKILAFTASTAVRITSACEHVCISNLIIDSPSYKGLQIDSSHNVCLNNVAIFLNDNEVANGIDYATVIGEYSSSDLVTNLFMNLRVQNTGGTVLKLSNIKDSIININATNGHLATGNNYPITTGVEYGSNIDNTIINLLSSNDITSATGTISGFFTNYSDNKLQLYNRLKIIEKSININQSYTPTNSNDSFGDSGELAWDDDYIYIKTSNGWKRVPLQSF